MAGSAYSRWDRGAAVERALKHADSGAASDLNGDAIWNFAFGSNVNSDKVASRGMRPLSAVRGRLAGHSLLFNHVGGFGNIESVETIRAKRYDLSRLAPPVPEEMHGMLLQLTRKDFAELARQEYAYDTIEVAVEVYPDDNGSVPRIQHALAFKTSACALTTEKTLPSRRYIDIIRHGARASGLESSFCDWLDSIPSS
jgi:hypothetical protein